MLSFYYSKPIAVLKLIVLLALGGRALWLAWLGIFSGHPVFFISGLIALFALLLVAPPFVPDTLRGLHWTGPVVSFDDEGVHDIRNRPQFIPWDQVSSINLGARRFNRSHLLFTLRQPLRSQVYPGYLSALVLLWRWLVGQADWRCILGPLKGRPRAVLEQARQYHRRAIARDIPGTSYSLSE